MSPVVEIINRLNYNEVERFQKVNFINSVKKKLLEKYELFPYNETV